MFSDIILLSAENTMLSADNIKLSLTITCYQYIVFTVISFVNRYHHESTIISADNIVLSTENM
jgi:hypothetical protein